MKKDSREAVLSMSSEAFSLRSDSDVRRLQTFRSTGYFELDGSALRKSAEAVALNRGKVHEDIFSTVSCDETEALRFVEPLHGTSCFQLEISFLLLPDAETRTGGFHLLCRQTTQLP